MKSRADKMGKSTRGQTITQMIVLLSMWVFFCFPFLALSQNALVEELSEAELADKKEISVSELASLMQQEESEIFLIDLRIVAKDGDEGLLSQESFDPLYVISPSSHIKQNVKKLNFFSCVFDVPLQMTSWTVGKIDMLNCQVNALLTFENFNGINDLPIQIENCLFSDVFEIKNDLKSIGSLKIRNSLFRKNLLIENTINYLLLSNCCFIADQGLFEMEDPEKTHFQFSIEDQSIGTLDINRCEFFTNGIPNLFSIDFSGSTIGNLSMFGNKLHSIDLSWGTVEKSLLIDSLQVEAYIGILNFDFPDKNTNIPWYNLGGEKLALLYSGESDLLMPFQAKTNKQLANTLDYNDLISAYTKFNALFHDRGDITSANASYVEIKTIETRRQAYIQEVSPSFNNLINYQLNVFLSKFSDYATNPGKAIKYSLWILFIFTVLYMFSFSGWDKMNYAYYLEQITLFSKYIKNDDPVDRVYPRKENPHENSMDVLKGNYLKAGKKVPRLLKWFGGGLLFIGKFRFEIVPNLIRLFNFQPNEWRSLSNTGKLKSSILIFLISFTFLLYVIVVKFFNSLILSLNSFVVIGFGALPEGEDGLAMYLSIIEGIIGWFLLMIFTITLLSQVLQSAG